MQSERDRMTAEGFDQSAEQQRHATWERAHEIGSPTHRLRTRLVLKTVRSLQGRFGAGPTCLDAGCGTGEFSLALAKDGWSVTGFDPSEYAVELARERARRVGTDLRFEVATTDDFSSDETFDLVIAVDVLEHIEDDAGALRRLAGYLRPGGALLVTVPMDPALWSTADEFSGHFRRYTRDSLAGVAGDAGLTVDSTASYGFPVTRLLWKTKRRVPAAESWLVNEGKRPNPLRLAVARAVSGLAQAATSIDRLFTRSDKGVGLLAVFRK